MSDLPFNDLSRTPQDVRQAELVAVARVMSRGWFVMGPELDAFEHAFADYCGLAHAVGVANGTDALELAFLAVGVQPGDEIILAPNAGFYATTALRAIGATPVYADIDPISLNVDAVCARSCLTERTRAIVATHLYGRLSNVAALRELCDERGIALIEDCAQAHGAERDGRRAGAWGDASAFSFYPTKNLGALGDAGMVVTPRSEVAERVRRLRQYGWSKKYHAVDGPARNSRLDEIQAAVLLERLTNLDRMNARRREIATRYASVRNANLQHPVVAGKDYVAHLYVIQADERDSFRSYLTKSGIGCDIHYPVLDPDQPALRGLIDRAPLPVATASIKRILSLPCFPQMSATEINRVCDALASWQP